MRKALISLIRFYQKHVSPAFPSCCRYTPSCSHYGIEAIEKHGAFKGSMLTIWRILRCNPFSKGGYDPVPEPKSKPNSSNKED